MTASVAQPNPQTHAEAVIDARKPSAAADSAKDNRAQAPGAIARQTAAPHKWLIAVSVILGPILEVLDSSIVNVSLPHMQGSFSASVDEVAWVVTSYLVANGIMIPMTGWISARFGRKRYFLVSLCSFVAASAL